MKTCGGDGDCRFEYRCRFPREITSTGEFDPNLPVNEQVARIIDLEGNRATAKICVALPPTRGLGQACQADVECDPGATGGAFCCEDEDQCGSNVDQCVANCSSFSSDGMIQENEGDVCADNSECAEGLFCCLVPDAAGNCDFNQDQSCTCQAVP
jgi:hypothetical protein